MPTKDQTKTFIRKHKEIKVPLSQNVFKLNQQVDKAVNELNIREIKTEWNELKDKYDYKKPAPKPRPVKNLFLFKN